MSKRRRKTRQRQPARDRSIFDTLLNKWTLGGAALILIGVLGFLIAANRQPSPATPSQPAATNNSDIPYPEVPRTPLADAKAQYDAGAAFIVDARTQDQYAASHIPGAISLPLSDLSTQNPDLPRDQDIVLYCT